MAWFNSGNWDDGSINLVTIANVLHEITTAIQERYDAINARTPFGEQIKIGWELDGHATPVTNPTVADFKTQAGGFIRSYRIGNSIELNASPVYQYITTQAHCVANMSYGETGGAANGSDLWKAAYVRFQLPDLSGYDIEEAYVTGICQNDVGSGSGFESYYFDDCGAWSEASDAATLAALTFNAAISTDIGLRADIPANIGKQLDILGTSAKGLTKFYDDNPTGGQATLKVVCYESDTGTRDMLDDAFNLGDTLGSSGGEGTQFWTRASGTAYPRVTIKYTDPNWSGTGGGLIGQIRRAIEGLIETWPYPHSSWADYFANWDVFPVEERYEKTVYDSGSGSFTVEDAFGETLRFYDFVGSAEWTLSSLLSKGSYGSSWVTIDRWQNPDIWMQIQEAIEELTYIIEQNELRPAGGASEIYTDTTSFDGDSSTAPAESMATMQSDSWDNISADAYLWHGLRIDQATARVRVPPHRCTVSTNVVAEYTVYGKSYTNIGALAGCQIGFRQKIPGYNFVSAASIDGGAGETTIVLNTNNFLTWSPSETSYTWDGVAFEDQTPFDYTDIAADTYSAAEPGEALVFTFEIPVSNPCVTQDDYDTGAVPETRYSGKGFYPHYLKIIRLLSAGSGLTYG